MPEQDIASQWKSFDPERRDRLLKKMTPEQKKKLRSSLEAKPVSPATPVNQELQTPGALKRFATSAGEGIGLVTPRQGYDFFRHPIDTAQGMLKAQGDLGERAVSEFKEKNYGDAAAHGIEYLMPGLGPTLAHSGDQLNSGDIAGGIGTMVGAGATIALDPERIQGGLSKVGQLRTAAKEGIQPIARKVTGVETAVKDSVEKASGKQATAIAETGKEAQRIGEENAAGEHTLDLRRKTEGELQKKTDAYFAKEDAVKGKVKAANDEKWNAWREKVGDATVDMQPVRDTVDRVSANFPEVKQLLKDTAPSEADMSAVNQQYVADRRGFMRQYGYGDDYDALQPERRTQVDTMMERMGLHPEEGGVAIDAAKPMSIKQLHDLKTQVGWKVFRHEYPPNVTGAMKQVLKSLDQAEARASIERGAIDELQAARESHAQYQEAFGRSKPKRALEGEARKKGANPEAYSEKEEQERLKAVAKHDPSLATAHTEIQNIRAKIKSLPSEDALRKGVKQIPHSPDAPVVDIKKVAQDAIAQKAKNWGSFNARDIGILSSSYIGGFLQHLFTGGGEGLPIAVTAYEGGKYAAGRALNNPKVVDWLAKTPQAEIDVISKIPGADKVKIVEGLTQVAVDNAKYGKPVNLSPGVRSLLGPGNVARIISAQVPGAQKVNNRKDALELLRPTAQ